MSSHVTTLHLPIGVEDFDSEGPVLRSENSPGSDLHTNVSNCDSSVAHGFDVLDQADECPTFRGKRATELSNESELPVEKLWHHLL